MYLAQMPIPSFGKSFLVQYSILKAICLEIENKTFWKNYVYFHQFIKMTAPCMTQEHLPQGFNLV